MSQTFIGRARTRPIATMAPRMARRMRKPTHNAYLHFLPHVLRPFVVTPVVPGDTLKNILFQARVLTTPVKNRLVGWWLETYWFYVSHNHMRSTAFADTNIADHLLQMAIDLNYDLTSNAGIGADAAPWNAVTGDIPYFKAAYAAVVDEFFRGDNENAAFPGTTLGGFSLVRLRMPGWWDSIIPENTMDTALGGVADDPVGDTVAGSHNTVGEVARAIATYNNLLALGVTNLTYDDWLRSFGVRVAAPVEDRPELIRYTREWQYPATTVTVDSTAQRVSAVLSWSIQGRADKDRHFRQPGVIIGCVVARPKLYHDRQQLGVGLLKDTIQWQTPFMQQGLYDTIRDGSGPLAGYVHDSRDLFHHGDQYVAADRGELPARVAFPADGKLDYPDATLIDGLFVDGADGYVMMDAAVKFNIASRVGPDHTPTTL